MDIEHIAAQVQGNCDLSGKKIMIVVLLFLFTYVPIVSSNNGSIDQETQNLSLIKVSILDNETEILLIRLDLILNQDGSVDSILTEYQKYSVDPDIIFERIIKFPQEEEIDESSIEIINLYNPDKAIVLSPDANLFDCDNYFYDFEKKEIRFCTTYRTNKIAFQIKYKYEPTCDICYWTRRDKGIVRKDINFTLPPSSKPYKVITTVKGGDNIFINQSKQSELCVPGWKHLPSVNGYKCVIDDIKIENQQLGIITIPIQGYLISYLEGEKARLKEEQEKSERWKMTVAGLIGVVLGASLGIFGNFGLQLLQRRLKKKDILKIVATDIRSIRDDINRELEYFSGRTGLEDFSGFEAENWITIQSKKYPPLGQNSRLDASNLGDFFDNQTPFNTELFESKLIIELGILPVAHFTKIHEFYKTELHHCNYTLNTTKSYVEKVRQSEPMAHPFSSLMYIKRILFARKMADEILEILEN